jgi:hypothetical protein
VPQDYAKSLFHRALAARLYDEAGEEFDAEARIASAQRGTLARTMPQDEVAKVWREVLAWKPTPPP